MPKQSGALAHSCTISFRHEQGDPVPRRVFVDGVEVTGAIRTAEIDRSVSAVSAVPAVRQALRCISSAALARRAITS